MIFFNLLLHFAFLSFGQEKMLSQDECKKYEQFLQQFQKQKNIPSISFAILQNQQVIYSGAMGFADINKRIPATDTTVYSIASLTKPIAATLIMKLYEQHKLDIDSSLRHYWQEYDAYFSTLKQQYPGEYRQLFPYIKNYNYKLYNITIRQHLTHTAEGEPGTAFKYNGFLYGTLAKVIDNIVPAKFIGLMDSCIFKQLHFTSSFLRYDDLIQSGRTQNFAKPYAHYDENTDSLKERDFPGTHELNAGAGLICSVKDLAKFDIAFDKNEIISANTKSLMLTPAKGLNGKEFQYGIGWFLSIYHQHHLIYHYGLQESYSGFYLKIPDQNITLIVLANSSDLTADYNKDIQNTNIEVVPYVNEFLKLALDN